jgi:hypothetical protein
MHMLPEAQAAHGCTPIALSPSPRFALARMCGCTCFSTGYHPLRILPPYPPAMSLFLQPYYPPAGKHAAATSAPGFMQDPNQDLSPSYKLKNKYIDTSFSQGENTERKSLVRTSGLLLRSTNDYFQLQTMGNVGKGAHGQGARMSGAVPRRGRPPVGQSFRAVILPDAQATTSATDAMECASGVT